MKKVVIGIGNPLKKDDNIGNIVIDELKKKGEGNNNLFIRAETNPENFLGKVRSFNPKVIYFVDAVDFEGKVSEVKVFSIDDVLNQSLSTHGISVKVFKDFFPDAKIYVIGIKPEVIGYGEGLSSVVKNKLNGIIENVEKIIKSSTL